MNQWTIGKRIAMGFSLVITCMIGLAMLSGVIMTSTGATVAMVDRAHLPVAELASEFERTLLSARIHFVYFLMGNRPERGEAGMKLIGSAEQLVVRLRETTNSNKELYRQREVVENLDRSLREYKSMATEVIAQQNGGAWDQAAQDAYVAKWAPIANAVTDIAKQLGQNAVAASRESSAASAEQLHRMTWILLSAALVFLCLSLFFSTLAARGITRTLKTMSRQLAESAEQVSHSATQLSTASQALSQGASQQAAALEQTSASSEQISAMATKNTSNSQQAASLTMRCQERFEEAERSVNELVIAIHAIAEQGNQVSKIVKTIDEIAFQTNLLALNASVEAARAGEMGLGFAVVADEVRALAHRSATAAKDTATLISESVTKSNAGRNKMDELAGLFHTLAAEEAKINSLVGEVRVAAQEQTRGLEQITQVISQMDQVTQRNAATAEESASSAGELAAQSDTMHELASQLEVLVGSSHGDLR